MLDEVGWLEAAGHQVAHFSTRHPENYASPWSEYFSPYLEIGVDSTLARTDKIRAGVNMFWNCEAAARFARLLRDFRPDIVHVHGIHRQISPSILVSARRANVPVVQTLHDCHPICPAGALLRGDGVVCAPPLCGRVNAMPCVVHNCVHDSRARSAIAATELLWRRWVLGYATLVSAFVCPSHYLATLVGRFGYPGARLHVLPNAVPLHVGTGNTTGGTGFVYAGRLSQEKGLPTLLEATRKADVSLTIAGDGPLATRLRAAAPPKVRFIGRVGGDVVDELLRAGRAAVLPSECIENAPMAVLEAMALGRPVIASRIGGIPEQVRDDIEGILVRPGDSVELATALRRLSSDDGLAARMGRAAAKRATALYAPGPHTTGLLDIYESVLATRAVGRGGAA